MEGRLVTDKYRLVRLLGKGGMGSVWLAQHTTLKSEVAIKLIDSELSRHAQARSRFVREAQIAARIKSAHVVQIFDHGETPDGELFIAMECLTGMSLRDRLTARGALPLDVTAKIVSHVCRALARAHEAGLVHRDLKPENVFITRDGDEEVVKVLDFGVAKATDALGISAVDPTRTGALLGTPYYMSPEQAQGLKTVDFRTDLWALGVVVFECITGARPFSGEALGPLLAKILAAPIPTPSSVAPRSRIPPEMDAWMKRALERDPTKRFGSAKELSDAYMVAAGTMDSLQHADSLLARDTTGRVPDAVESAPTLGVVPPANTPPGGDGVASTLAMQSPSPFPPQPRAAPIVAGKTIPLGQFAPAPAAGPLSSTAAAQPPVAPSRVPWMVAVFVLAAVVVLLTVVVVVRH